MKRTALPGLLLCAVALLAALLDAHAALAGWLAAFVLASCLPLGALCLAMLLRIVPGGWRKELGESATEATSLLPGLPILALPIVIGMAWLFPWFAGGLRGFKSIYLTPAFFGIRVLAILAGATALGVLLRATGRASLAIGGLIAFVILHGILAVDLVLSLDPEFHSSGFGLYFLGLQMLTALALLVLKRRSKAENPALLGVLLLTALLFWAYLSFMPYFIAWSSNLVPGVKWYRLRGSGIWAVPEYAMIALRLVPALLLLFPPVRRSRPWLRGLSCAILLGSAIEAAWLVLPSVTNHLGLGLLTYLIALAGMILLMPAARFLPFARRQAA